MTEQQRGDCLRIEDQPVCPKDLRPTLLDMMGGRPYSTVVMDNAGQ